MYFYIYKIYKYAIEDTLQEKRFLKALRLIQGNSVSLFPYLKLNCNCVHWPDTVVLND